MSQNPKKKQQQATKIETRLHYTFKRMASRLGWRAHIDNTVQFILWAGFGSAAIHLINIKQAYAERERKLDTKIGLLRNVIERIGKGEQVDVAKELRVGRTEEEREWEEMMGAFKDDADKAINRPDADKTVVRAAATTAQQTTAADSGLKESKLGEQPRKQSGRFWAT
jgi:hypothetical protein